MKKTAKNRSLSSILCVVLIAAIVMIGVLAISGCKDGEATESGANDEAENVSDSDSTAETSEAIGTGAKSFYFTAVDGEGKTIHSYSVSTDADTVGAALQELELIEGEEGSYGLYVQSVCGVSAIYEKDGTYWAFYVNGEYAISGVDVTEIENGASYSFKIEK